MFRSIQIWDIPGVSKTTDTVNHLVEDLITKEWLGQKNIKFLKF